MSVRVRRGHIKSEQRTREKERQTNRQTDRQTERGGGGGVILSVCVYGVGGRGKGERMPLKEGSKKKKKKERSSNQAPQQLVQRRF